MSVVVRNLTSRTASVQLQRGRTPVFGGLQQNAAGRAPHSRCTARRPLQGPAASPARSVAHTDAKMAKQTAERRASGRAQQGTLPCGQPPSARLETAVKGCDHA